MACHYRSTGSVSVWGFRWAESVWRGSGFRDGATRCLHNPCPYAIGRRCPMRPAGSPQALERSCQGFAARAADSHSRGAPGTPRLPPSGSTAGSALSPTPPQGGSDTGAPYASLEITPPLRGESQKPSRQAKADAVGGGSRPRQVAALGHARSLQHRSDLLKSFGRHSLPSLRLK